LAALSGCGGAKLGTVTGRITLDGQPLTGAEIAFQPQSPEGSPALGETDHEGRYELRYTRSQKGAFIGPNTVRITTAIERENDKGIIVRARERVPAKYNVKTELVRDVKSGRNTIDFDLVSGGEIIEQRN
jgi:hypothetical protein